MAAQSILLAITEPGMLVDIIQALGAEWEATSVACEEDALAQLENRSFDALLVDFNLGSPDASELLNQALEKRPETNRFLLAYEGDLALVAAKVLGAHEILPKPIEPAALKSRIENGVQDSNSGQSDSDEAPVGAVPTIPAIYSEALQALDSLGATTEQVAKIIARDEGLTTEVLRLTRSAYMGLPRDLTDPLEAVESLGLETVKALVMARKFLAEHSDLKSGYLSLAQIREHSTNVAQIARDLVLFETGDRTQASQALIAGLLHDFGKVVLASNFDDLYGRVHSLARKQPVPLWDIEKEMFGANHGEIGGCLLGMWNLPLDIVEAAALHHEPPLGEHEHLTPLAAVHVANVLEHQLRPNEELRVAPIINTPFLNELGLLQRLPVWRAAFANRDLANEELGGELAETDQPGSGTLVPESAPSSRSTKHSRGPSAATRITTSGEPNEDSREAVPAAPFWQSRWVYAGVAAGVLLLLALALRPQSNRDEATPVYARTATWQTPSQPAVPSTTPLETVAAPAPQVIPAASVSEAASATSASTGSQPEIPPPAPQPVPVITAQPSVTNVLPPSLSPQESALPDFRLNGIFYTVGRPSAILNGKTVHVGERVNGATVLSISQTDVTLQIKGLRRTYALPSESEDTVRK